MDPSDSTSGPVGGCPSGVHAWTARFRASGRLAYWECSECGRTDRDPGTQPDMLEDPVARDDSAPGAVSHGRRPPVGRRRWITPGGTILREGDPCSVRFSGMAIPGLDEAHEYAETGADGLVVRRYLPSRERLREFYERFVLARYQVVGRELVRFEAYCYEESTYDTPFATEPVRQVVLSPLVPARARLQ